ncbi:MAG: hypothetical protein GY696_24915 [Gammaproteobacteria bacterium]|nr:hypothetical protein [Gammaproteobacteria bacterium]
MGGNPVFKVLLVFKKVQYLKKIFEPKMRTKLSNRFKCFERNTPEHDDILREIGRTSPPLCSSPKTETKTKKSKIRKTPSTKSSDSPLMSLSYEKQLRQFKDSIDTSNKSSPENVPSDKLMPSSSGIPGVGGSPPPPPIPPVAAVVSAPEITSTNDPPSLFSQQMTSAQQLWYQTQLLHYQTQQMWQRWNSQSHPP